MDSSLTTNLEALANSWTGQLLSLIQSLAPAHIRPYVFVYEEEADGKYIIHATVNRYSNPRPNYGSMDAKAQEYGSGIRARTATQHMIDIVPKQETGWLVFTAKDGKFVRTKHVSHPGINAANDGEGYVAPAIKELRTVGKAELSAAVRKSILSDIRRSWGSNT